jgi:hypothetical protein
MGFLQGDSNSVVHTYETFIARSVFIIIIIGYSLKRYSNPIAGLDRPLGFQEVEAPRISRQSAHEGGKVFSPTHRPPLPPRKYSCYSFLLEAESTPGP